MIDIIIVNHNSTDYLIDCVASLNRALKGVDATICVQDNASTDAPERLRARYPGVVLENNIQNIGFAAANNKVIRKSAAPYALLLNPDTVVSENCIASLLAFMEKNRDVGIAGPRILESDGRVQGSARSFPSLLTAFFGRSSMLTKWFPTNPISRANIWTAQSNGLKPREVDWISGACMIVRRNAIEDVGLMDERFFLYWEDADWCRRMWQKGWKVIYFPRASILHHAGKSSGTNLLPSIYHFHRSSYILHEKYTEFPLMLMNPLVLSVLALRGIALALSLKLPFNTYMRDRETGQTGRGTL